MVTGSLATVVVTVSRWRHGRRERGRSATSRLQRINLRSVGLSRQSTGRGLRHPVENLLELLSSGTTTGQVLDDCPDLERDDLLALESGALAAGGSRVLGAA